jgi:flagellar basal body-associated protein FliL
MAFWPFDDKKNNDQTNLKNSGSNSDISEDELKNYLKENPSSQKVMENISKPKDDEEIQKIPALGPRPIKADEDFRPPSAQNQLTDNSRQITVNNQIPPTQSKPQLNQQPNQKPITQPSPQPNPQTIPQAVPQTNPSVSGFDQSRDKQNIPITTPQILPKPISPVKPVLPVMPTLPPTNQPVKKPSKIKSVLLGIIIFLIIIILAGAIWWFFLATGTLNLNITPTDATIQVNSQTAQATDSLKLKPGNYTIKAQKNGYVPYQKQISIQKLKSTDLKVSLNQIPKPDKLIQDNVVNLYILSDLINVLGNDGKTLYQLTEPTITANQESGITNQESINTSLNYVKKALTPNTLANVQNIIWNPKESLAIFKIKQNKKLLVSTPFANSTVADGTIMTWLYDFKRYDLVNQTATFWGADISDIVWSPDGQTIYYYYAPAGGEITLISATKDNQNLKRILNLKQLGIENPQISISPDGKYLTLVPRSSKYETNYVYLFEIATSKLTKLVPVGQNLEARFTPDSKSIIYSSFIANTDNPAENSELSIIGINGQNKKDLKVKSFLERSTITQDSNFLITALSNGQNQSDTFVKINLATVEQQEFVFTSNIIVNPAEIYYTISGNTAYFIKDGFIYSLQMVGKTYQ